MAFFDFLDSRKSLAKWSANIFKQIQKQDPRTPVQDIIDFALYTRYKTITPKPHELTILQKGRPSAKDIFSFCYLIADVELLSHLSDWDKLSLQMGGKNIMLHTYDVIDQELFRLGFKRQ